MFGAPINVNYEPFESNQISESDIIEVGDFDIPNSKIAELRRRICEQEYKCEKLREEVDKLPGPEAIKQKMKDILSVNYLFYYVPEDEVSEENSEIEDTRSGIISKYNNFRRLYTEYINKLFAAYDELKSDNPQSSDFKKHLIPGDFNDFKQVVDFAKTSCEAELIGDKFSRSANLIRGADLNSKLRRFFLTDTEDKSLGAIMDILDKDICIDKQTNGGCDEDSTLSNCLVTCGKCPEPNPNVTNLITDTKFADIVNGFFNDLQVKVEEYQVKVDQNIAYSKKKCIPKNVACDTSGNNFNPASCISNYNSVIKNCNKYSNLDHPEAYMSEEGITTNCDNQQNCKYVNESKQNEMNENKLKTCIPKDISSYELSNYAMYETLKSEFATYKDRKNKCFKKSYRPDVSPDVHCTNPSKTEDKECILATNDEVISRENEVINAENYIERANQFKEMECIPKSKTPLTTYKNRKDIYCSGYSKQPHNKCETETNGRCKYVSPQTARDEIADIDQKLVYYNKRCIPKNINPLSLYENRIADDGQCGKFSSGDFQTTGQCSEDEGGGDVCNHVSQTAANQQKGDYYERLKCIPKNMGSNLDELIKYRQRLDKCNMHSKKRNKQECNEELENSQSICHKVVPQIAEEQEDIYEDRLAKAEELAERQRLSSLKCIPQNIIPFAPAPVASLAQYQLQKLQEYDDIVSSEGDCGQFTGLDIDHCTTKPESRETCRYVDSTIANNQLNDKNEMLDFIQRKCIPREQLSLTSDKYEDHIVVQQCDENSNKIFNNCETSPETSEKCKYVSESERENQKKAYDDLITSNRSKKCIPSQVGDLRTYKKRYDKCYLHSGNINDTECIGEKNADCSYVLPQIAQYRSAQVNEMKRANLQKVCFPRQIKPRDNFPLRSRECHEYSEEISDLYCTEEQECQYGTKVEKDSQSANYYKEKRCIPKEIHKRYKGVKNDGFYRDVYRTHCRPKSRKPVNECDNINIKGIKPCKYVEQDVYNTEKSILEGFANPNKDLSNMQEDLSNKSEDSKSNNIIPKSILFGCLFFILSHKKSMNILTQISGKISQTNQNLTMMVIFCFLYYIISKLI